MNDDDFLRDLADRADRAVPDVTVHTERVIPRAHHRRRVIRTTQTVGVIAALAIIGGGITWAWTDRPEPAEPQPTVTSTPTPTPTPTPTSTPESTPTAITPPEPTTPVIPEVSAEFPFWYTRAVTHWPDDPEIDGTYWESWQARDQVGVQYWDGDPTTASGIFPDEMWFQVTLDGAPVSIPQAADQLPSDAASLAALLLPSPSEILDDEDPEAVAATRAETLIRLGGVIPGEVRVAALQLIRESPSATVAPGFDDDGRPGLVIQIDGGHWGTRSVIDPDTLLMLQADGHEGVGSTTFYQEAVATLPMDPPDSTSVPDW